MKTADLYSGIARELLAKLRRLSFFTGHAGSIGVSHEEIVKEAIRPFLSRRFSLRTGFVFTGQGTVSPQCDIIVVDENDPSPYFYQLGDLVVVHPRAVAMVIEVKTKLDRRDFHAALAALRRCGDVAAGAGAAGVFLTAVFAFEGAEFTPGTLDDWYRSSALPDEPQSYPQVIYVLTQGALHAQRITDGVLAHRVTLGEGDDEVKARTLSIFLGVVRKALELKAGMVDSNPFQFADFTDLKWSQDYLRLGIGLCGPQGHPTTT